MNMRMDPLQVEVAQRPSQHERIVQAIMAVARSKQPNGQQSNGDGV
jgi:hypothetical protein